MIKVLLADDHKMFLEGLYSILNHEEGFEIIGQAEDGIELLEKLKKLQPDVIVLDINMPRMDGIDSAARIVAEYPHISLLMVSMFKKSVMVERLINMGVKGYILKNAGKRELITAVRSVANGKPYFAEEIKAKIEENQHRKEDQPGLELTERELQILENLARGLTTAQISANLYISSHTVETHRKNLMFKSKAGNVVQLINWARENGWLKD